MKKGLFDNKGFSPSKFIIGLLFLSYVVLAAGKQDVHSKSLGNKSNKGIWTGKTEYFMAGLCIINQLLIITTCLIQRIFRFSCKLEHQPSLAVVWRCRQKAFKKKFFEILVEIFKWASNVNTVYFSNKVHQNIISKTYNSRIAILQRKQSQRENQDIILFLKLHHIYE